MGEDASSRRRQQFVARARFSCAAVDRDARAEFREQVIGLFGELRKQGHIIGDEVAGYVGGALELTFAVALPDSLAVDRLEGSLRARWEQVVARCTMPPTIAVIDDDAAGQTLDWREHATLYLMTHAFDEASPVCGGEDGVPIPLYLLPLEPRERERIYFWQAEYRDLDRVYFDSGPLELAAYAQTADPGSELARKGRQLCQQIERATGRPTYYYLHRYYGRAGAAEQTRVCPGCGGAWARPSGEGRGLAWFDFRCDECRLVSHVAPQYAPGEAHAEIGEWSGERAQAEDEG